MARLGQLASVSLHGLHALTLSTLAWLHSDSGTRLATITGNAELSSGSVDPHELTAFPTVVSSLLHTNRPPQTHHTTQFSTVSSAIMSRKQHRKRVTWACSSRHRRKVRMRRASSSMPGG